jgi:predicted membrane channel-forming protein YqfA (hemolysin III family)
MASLAFGVVGILFAVTIPWDEAPSELNHWLFVALASIGFVVLSSFAVSVAARFLDPDR